MKTVVKPISVSVVLTEYDNFIIFADGYQYYLSVVNSQFVWYVGSEAVNNL